MTRINDNGTERQMTAAESLLYDATKAQIIADEQAIDARIEAQLAAKQSARAKLAALGLNESEINALVG